MNVSFSPSICEGYLKELFDDSAYTILRGIAADLGVPSLEETACAALTNIVSIKKPAKSIDIGCGIGVSSLAILRGHPETELTALDGNLERLLVFNNYFKDYKNVTSYQVLGDAWLAGREDMYDLIFIDSVKRDYPKMWQLARKRLNSGGVVVFDDILIYGYVFCEDAEIPQKYIHNVRLIREFLTEIFSDDTINAQLIPVTGGLLVISLKQ